MSDERELTPEDLASRGLRPRARGERPEHRPKAAPPMEEAVLDGEPSEDDLVLRKLFEEDSSGGDAGQPGAASKPAESTPPPAEGPDAARGVAAEKKEGERAPEPAPAPAPQASTKAGDAADAPEVHRKLTEALAGGLGPDTPKDWRDDLLELRKERLLRRLAALRQGDPAMTEEDDVEVLSQYLDLRGKIGDGATIDLAYAVVRSRKLSPERISELQRRDSGAQRAREADKPAGQAEVAGASSGTRAKGSEAPMPPAAGGRPAPPAASKEQPVLGTVDRRARDRARMSKGGEFERDIAAIWGKK